MRIPRKYLPPIAVLLVSTIGAAYAVTTFFTQTFPAIPATTPAITSNCTTLTPNAATVIAGTSGFVEFDCSGTSPFGTTVAYVVTVRNTATPVFALPTGYTSLFIYNPTLGTTNCVNSSNTAQLTSGSPATQDPQLIDYCANYSDAPSTGLGSFTVTWSQ